MSRHCLHTILALCLLCGLLGGPSPAVASDREVAFAVTFAINPDGSAILTPGAGNHSHTAHETITMSVAPDAGYGFVRWDDVADDPNSPTTTVTVTGDMMITAILAAEMHTLKVDISGKGEVTSDPTGTAYASGDNVRLLAQAEPGWVFSHWLGPVSDPESPETTVTMTRDRTILAVFEPDTTEVLEVEVSQILPGTPGPNLPRTGGETWTAVGLGGALLLLGLFLRKRSALMPPIDNANMTALSFRR